MLPCSNYRKFFWSVFFRKKFLEIGSFFKVIQDGRPIDFQNHIVQHTQNYLFVLNPIICNIAKCQLFFLQYLQTQKADSFDQCVFIPILKAIEKFQNDFRASFATALHQAYPTAAIAQNNSPVVEAIATILSPVEEEEVTMAFNNFSLQEKKDPEG